MHPFRKFYFSLVVVLYAASASAQQLQTQVQSIGSRIQSLLQTIVPIIAVVAIIFASIAMMNAEPDAKRRLTMVIIGSAIAAMAPYIYPWISGT